MNLGFRRAVIIGIGGTGVRTLVHIKREFIKHFQGMPPIVRLLGFDTDEASKETLKLNGRDIALSSPEFMKLTALKLRSLVDTTPELREWIPTGGRMSWRNVVDGTGGRRPSGRLAVFNRADQVFETITKAYHFANQLKDESFDLAGTRCEVVDPNKTSVFIVCSLAGGTGSGMFLDIAHMCRSILGELSDPIFGFLLLAGVYAHKPAAYFVEANTYGALRELDYFMDNPEPIEVHYPGRKAPILWGGDEHRPFTYAYLIDNENERRLRVNDIDPMLDFVARSIFLHMTVETGTRTGQMQSYFNNLSSILDTLPRWPGRLRPRYMGIGMSTLLLPVEQVTALAAMETVGDLLQEVLLGDDEAEQRGQQLARTFCQDKRLQCEALIERFRGSQGQLDLVGVAERDARRKDPGYVRNWRLQQSAAIENHCARLLDRPNNAAFSAAVDDLVGGIVRDCSRLLRQKDAARRSGGFLAELLRSLRQERDRLVERLAKHRSDRESLTYPKDVELQNAFTGATRRMKLNRVLGSIFATLESERNLSLEQANAGLAVSVLAQGIAECESLLASVDRLRDLVVKARELSWSAYRKLLETKPLEDAFTIRLGEEYLLQNVREIKQLIGPDLILEALAPGTSGPTKSIATFLDLISRNPEGLHDWLLARVRPHFSKIEAVTIEEVLRREKLGERVLDPTGESLTAICQKFVDKACPMWTITTPPGARVEEVFVFGIPSPEQGVDASTLKALINEGKVELRSEGGARPGDYYAGTWEKYAIRGLKIKAAIPLWALTHVAKEYRDKYVELELDPESRYTAHVNKAWVGGGVLPDIVEASGGDRNASSATGSGSGS